MRLKLKFSFPLAEMLVIAGTLIDFMRLDIQKFNLRGVSEAEIDEFEADIESQKVIMSDTFYKYEVTIVIQQKNEVLKSIKRKIRAMAGIFKQVYGGNDIRYKTLNIKKIPQMTEADIYLQARRIARLSEADFAVLSAAGLTQADIDALWNKADELLNLQYIISTKKLDRELATEERISRANAVFTQMQYFCHVGRSIFDDTNPAKARSYMLYRNMGKKKKGGQAAGEKRD